MFNTMKAKKLKHLKDIIESAYKVIWETEYKRYATLLEREKARREYDQLKSRLSITETTIKGFPAELTPDQKNIVDDKIRIEAAITKAKDKMDRLDTEVYGAKPSEEHPDGLAGLDHKIDAWHERVAILKKYIKSL